MNKLLKTTIITALMLGLSSGIALAQSDQVQEAIDNAQESTEELITAKDEESPFTLQQRIEAYKDVINLSLTEIQDMKVKLLSIDLKEEMEEVESWRSEKVSEINEVIAHYEEEQEFINENEDEITEEEIISKAEKFKEWRQENYIPLNNEVQAFILMNKEEKIINTANKRWEKIKKDVSILKDANIDGVEKLEEMLSESKDLIDKSESQNNEARNLFLESIKEKIATTTESNATSTSTSTPEATSTATSTGTSSAPEVSTLSIENDSTTTPTSTDIETSTTSATGTTKDATTTIEIEDATTSTIEQSTTTPDSLDSSIKDLVELSLQNVRGSYQVFIEMSNFVRELLE